jgi:hypothetical protein
MARITMRNSQKATFAEVFEVYISAVTARGVKDKTIATYKQHFHAISKRLDVSMPINRLSSTVLDNMILQMRKTDCSQAHEEWQGSGHSPLLCDGVHSEGLHGSQRG